MDVETVGVCSVIFVVSAVVVYLISVLGTRETSFEEALEEKRRRALEEAAAASKTSQRQREANKKTKGKWGGRSRAKEAAPADAAEATSATQQAPPTTTHAPPDHVEFKEEAEVVLIPELEEEVEVVAPPPPPAPVLKQRPKQGQHAPLKPILVHKSEPKLATQPQVAEEAAISAVAAATVAHPSPKTVRRNSNSFRESVPKDEIELKHQHEQEVAQLSTETTAKPTRAAPPPPAAAVQSTVQSAAPKPSPQRGSAKKKAAKPPPEVDLVGSESRDLSAAELLALVRCSTRLNDAEEVQGLVDELLDRAHEGGANSWTKRGRDPEAELRKQLTEREKELEAERQHSQSHATKVKELRQELNQQLSRAAQLERTLKAHIETMEKSNKAAERTKEDNRQLQQKVQRLEAELSQAASATAEAARLHREEAEAKCRQEAEAVRAEGAEALARAQARIGALEATCQELSTKLQEETAARASSHVASENKVKELCKVHQAELDAEKEERKRQVATLEQRAEEVDQLAQERSRLANELQARLDDMASAHSKEIKDVHRRHTEAEAAAEASHKQALAEKEAQLEELRSELEAQRAKNNDLRTKNWEVVEALQAAERKAQAQAQAEAQAQAHRLTASLEALKKEHLQEVQSLQKRLAREQEQKERALLQRLLPKVKVENASELGHSEWVVRFEKEVQALQALEEKKAVGPRAHGDTNGSLPPSVPAEDLEKQRRLQELTQANTKLQAEVRHYQKVLASTEEILRNLQSSVEREEAGWRERERAHEREAERWKADLAEARKEARELQAHLRELQGIRETTTEMQAKLKELQQKLQEEESEKKILEQKYDEASKNARGMQTHLEGRVRELEELKLNRDDTERLEKELNSLRSELEKERVRNGELQDGLRGLQEALREARDQQAKNKVAEVSPGSPKTAPSSTNGPSPAPLPEAPSPSPTPSTEKEKDEKGSSSKK